MRTDTAGPVANGIGRTALVVCAAWLPRTPANCTTHRLSLRQHSEHPLGSLAQTVPNTLQHDATKPVQLEETRTNAT